MLQVLQDELGIKDEKVSWAIAAFGGGIGRCQSVCGALSAGAFALGYLKAVQHEDRGAARAQIRRHAGELYRAFQREFGATDCLTLIGYDFSTPEGYEEFQRSGTRQQKCNGFVEFVVRYVGDRLSS